MKNKSLLFVYGKPYEGVNDRVLGVLTLQEDGTGKFMHVSQDICSNVEDLDTDCLWDLLEGIKEEVDMLSAEHKFDLYRFTKFYINEFRFI